MKPIAKTRLPEKTALTLLSGPVLAAILLYFTSSMVGRPIYERKGLLEAATAAVLLTPALWWIAIRLLDSLRYALRMRWPSFYRRYLTREVYLPSPAYAALKNPLIFGCEYLPYTITGLKGYPLKAWVEKLSYRQLRAFKGRHGMVKCTDPYVKALLLSRMEWREEPAPGMETGYEYRNRPLHCGDLLKEPTEASLFRIVWDRQKQDWGVIDLHDNLPADDLDYIISTSLPFFLKQWEGLLRVLG